MAELSIKLKIGEREYPMRIDSNEEEQIRLNGKIINDKIRQFKEQYGIQDKQDLLAMTTFDLGMANIKEKKNAQIIQERLIDQIQSLETLVDQALQSI
jgi:cell division protein ZapA